jgi:hypothetical protein
MKQTSGVPFPNVPAGKIIDSVMTVLGTGNPDAGSVAKLAHGVGVADAPIDVVVVLKPAHWPCDCPSTQLGPWERVGAGELPKQ